jgi:alpha-beta hydrolase superfamily lysophospholipase
MTRTHMTLAALLVFAAGASFGGLLVYRYMEGRDRDRTDAAWSLACVVDQQPNRAELWLAWRVRFEATRRGWP